MLNDLGSPASLAATRRSGKARDLIAPGPDDAQLRRILQAGARVPDHGKLAPWRFVLVEAGHRAALGDRLAAILADENPAATPADLDAARAFAAQAPCLVVVLSRPVEGRIPLWEQQLSAGAACMSLLYAAHAEGYVGGWLTGWAAFSPAVHALFGAPGDRIAGFLFIGTPSRPPEERPRPALEAIVSTWRPE